jgi:hypothetical protein
MKTPLGLYAYPVAMLAALAGFAVALWGGLAGSLGLHECLLYVLLSLLTGWGAAARFDRLERRMCDR